jgi:hypothetical protein
MKKKASGISIKTISKSVDTKVAFKELLSKLRSNSDTAPSLEEITREVEEVRAQRYANKK